VTSAKSARLGVPFGRGSAARRDGSLRQTGVVHDQHLDIAPAAEREELYVPPMNADERR